MADVTRLLDAAAAGDRKAAADLLPLVYDELRKLAAARMAAVAPGHTLDATALVHGVYLRLIGDQQFDGRGHFSAAAEAMRRILVDATRRNNAEKHGGGRHLVGLHDYPADPVPSNDPVLALDAALTRLAAEDPVAARGVEPRHIAGLGHEQVAATLGVTVYLARQTWTDARAWPRDALCG